MTHFFADDGAKIHLQISGEGPALVLLHGWTSSHREWSPFIDGLQQSHRVYRWDARGHGGHPLGRYAPPTAQRMALDLHNLVEHYQLEEFAAVGHSMGALTLWQYIRDFGTDHLERVCFIDQSPKLLTSEGWDHGIYGDFDETRAEQLLTWLDQDFAEGVLKLTALGLNQRARDKYTSNALGWQKSRVALQAQDPAPLIACWKSLTAADYRDVLAQIDIPSLLIYGGESNFYRTETAHYVARQIPRSILHIYEGTDHSPHQWQRERFIRDLGTFLKTG